MIQESEMLTFEEIDRIAGAIALSHTVQDEEWPLEAWYRSICRTPIKDFEISDLARANEQRIHLEYVVPYSLNVLQKTPLIGDWFDGQLMMAMVDVPSSYWNIHQDQLARLMQVLSFSLSHPIDEVDDPALYDKIKAGRAKLESLYTSILHNV